MITLLAIGNIVAIDYLQNESRVMSSTLNMAGKVRMLGQRIGLQALSDSALSLPGPGNEQLTLAGHFETALQTLREGGVAFDLYTPPLNPAHQIRLATIEAVWQHYQQAIDRHAFQDQRQLVLDLSTELLHRTDLLLDALTVEGEQLQSRTVLGAYLLFGIDLILLIAAYLIFRHKVLKPIQSLEWQGREQAGGNYAARSYLDCGGELQTLSEVMNAASAHIEHLLQGLQAERRSLEEVNALFEALANNTLTAIYTLDTRFNISYASPMLCRLTGYSADELKQDFPLSRLFTPEEVTRARRTIMRRMRRHGYQVRYESRLVRKDGSGIDVEIFAATTRMKGRIIIIGIVLDISERREAEASARRAALVYRHTSEAMVITSPTAIIRDINPAFTAITGYARHEVLGRKMNMLSSGRHDHDFYEILWEHLHRKGQWHGDIHNRRKNGEEYIQHLRINASYNPDASVNSYIGLFSDVTKQRRQEATIWHQAHFDHLTGLPNRKMFNDALQHRLNQSGSTGNAFALLFLDLDLFKHINDTYGHDKGDALLKLVARRLQSCTREGDTIARMGGDEFTVIFHDPGDVENMAIICQKVLNSIARPYRVGEERLRVTVSIGVSLFPDHGTDAETLLKHADIAMYAAKNKGRNQYHIFSDELVQDVSTRRSLILDLHVALGSGQFRLHYQPIIELRSNRISSVEALIRLEHPTRGLVLPMEFIPLAEQTGLINPIGQWVFETATRQLAEWRAGLVPSLGLSLNVSPIQFLPGGIDIDNWVRTLHNLKLPLNALTVEITEGLLVAADPDFHHRVNALQASGITIALDDYGTGYSSIAYRRQFNIDIIKIDRIFIENIAHNTPDLNLCQAIIQMVHALGMRAVAEGVETEQQHLLLRAAGCDFGQGHWYGHPMPEHQISARLEAASISRRRR
ncbi:MAG: EAL domain-containing protein [Castellaniella sp.]